MEWDGMGWDGCVGVTRMEKSGTAYRVMAAKSF
jgi:hypothetical protein